MACRGRRTHGHRHVEAQGGEVNLYPLVPPPFRGDSLSASEVDILPAVLVFAKKGHRRSRIESSGGGKPSPSRRVLGSTQAERGGGVPCRRLGAGVLGLLAWSSVAGLRP